MNTTTCDSLATLEGVTFPTAKEAMLAIAEALGGPTARAGLLAQWADEEKSVIARAKRVARRIVSGLLAGLRGIASFAWGNSGETSLWDLIFQNTTFVQAPLIQGAATAGSFYIALHTANPGQTGSQTTSEAAYTGYARVAVARSSGGWTVTGNNPITAENVAAVTFPACTAGSETETYFSFGQATSGAGIYYGYGALTSSLAVSNGITPSFAINALQCTFT